MKGSKIDMLPGVATTPRVLLEKAIEDADNIEYIAMAVQHKDGTTDVYCTRMKLSDAVWLAWCFNKKFPNG